MYNNNNYERKDILNMNENELRNLAAELGFNETADLEELREDVLKELDLDIVLIDDEEADKVEERIDGLTDEEALNMTEEEIIDQLLGLDLDKDPEVVVILERLRIPITLKGLSEREINRIRKKCTTEKRVRGKIHKELREEEFNATLVAAATVKPNWNDKRLLNKYKASSGERFIGKHLLAGEINNLADKVLEVSGYDDELEEVSIEKTKN